MREVCLEEIIDRIQGVSTTQAEKRVLVDDCFLTDDLFSDNHKELMQATSPLQLMMLFQQKHQSEIDIVFKDTEVGRHTKATPIVWSSAISVQKYHA